MVETKQFSKLPASRPHDNGATRKLFPIIVNLLLISLDIKALRGFGGPATHGPRGFLA